VILDRIRGVCAVYGQHSVPYDSDGDCPRYRKLFAADAIRLAGSNPVLNFDHDSSIVLAARMDGALRCWQADCGICFEADIAADRRGAGVRDMMRGRADWRCSIGWAAGYAATWNHDGETPIETVTRASLARVHHRQPAVRRDCVLACIGAARFASGAAPSTRAPVAALANQPRSGDRSP
jgi:hypothetical protein